MGSGCGYDAPQWGNINYWFNSLPQADFKDPILDITNKWKIIDLPSYNPPDIQSLTIGEEPPEIPHIDFGTVPGIYQPPFGTIKPPVLGKKPTLDADKPTFYEPDQPEDLDAKKPGDAPTVGDVVIPKAPEIILPDVPQLSEITIPKTPELKLPTWDEKLPTSDLVVPENEFYFDEDPYASDVLTKTTSEILRMLNGGVGIPDSVWQQIFEKGADLEEQSAGKMIEEVTDDWVARGWSSPGGVMDKRIREARQTINHARNSLARDVTIKHAEAELDNLKYAIAQGLALETMMIGLHNSVIDRRLRAAELKVSLDVQIINAKIAIFNAELAAYQTSASVFEVLVRAEISRLELFKAEIEAVGLIVDVDKLRIDSYVAQVTGLGLAIDIHNAQLEGVKTIVEVDKIRTDAYRSEVMAYSEMVRSYVAEWDGYKAVMDGQIAKSDVFKSQVLAFSAEVDAYGAEISAEETRINAESKILDSDIERMKADTDRYSADIRYLAEKSSATAQVYSTRMDGYRAKAAYVSSQADAYKAEMMAHVAISETAITSAMEGARIAAAQADAMGKANVSAQETMARVYAQINASIYGQRSINLGASASGSAVFKYDCTE